MLVRTPASIVAGTAQVSGASSCRFPAVAIVGLALSLLTGTLVTAAVALPAQPEGSWRTPIALGAFIANAPGDAKRIDEFANAVGQMPAIVHWYQAWGDASPQFSSEKLEQVAARGAMPMVTWEPWSPGAGTEQSSFGLSRIADGEHDRYIRQWARDAAQWGQPMYVRWAHEMNGDWYPWCVDVNGNSAADYVAAWRHIVDIFREEGAVNVRWVWSPNRIGNGAVPFEALYPGDDVVDWVALDGYNRSTSPGTWRDFATLFRQSYQALTALTEKPVMIAETASTEAGGNKAEWIRQALLNVLPADFPRVKAVVWFHTAKASGDWRVDTSEHSLAAFRDVAASPMYRGRLS
jgi:beta-mannanase